jgi:hypothetical protein
VEHFRNLLVARLIEDRGSETEDRNLRSSVSDRLLDLPDQEIEELRAQVADLSTETLLDYFDFMAAGDEDVTRSGNPRFALETVLIRLATLPKTLPIAELLERLEKLEKKLPAAAVPPAKAPESSTQPFQTAVLATPAGGSFAGDQGGLWQNFVAFVGKEKKFLASHLEGSAAFALPPGQLKIGVAERHHLNYLQDPDNLAALKNLAKRFFGDDVAVLITAADSENPLRQSGSMAAVAMNPGEEGSPMVKEALRIFGGSIKTVRRENS